MSDKYRIEIVMSIRRDRFSDFGTLTTKDITLTATDDQLAAMYLADALQRMYTQTVTAGILAARELEEETA